MKRFCSVLITFAMLGLAVPCDAGPPFAPRMASPPPPHDVLPDPDRGTADKARAEKSAADKSFADKAAADKKASPDKARADKAKADKAAADKKAAAEKARVAKAKAVRLTEAWFIAPHMKCNNKTEHGFGPFNDTDDVCFEWAVKDSNQVEQWWAPARNQHYDFDKGQTQNIGRLVNISGMLKAGDGHATEFAIVLIERDQQPNPELAKVKDYISQLHVPRADRADATLGFWIDGAKALGKVVIAAVEDNKDDIIGVVHVRVENRKGKLYATWRAMNYAKLVSTKGNAATFNMAHDGANYDVTFDIAQK